MGKNTEEKYIVFLATEKSKRGKIQFEKKSWNHKEKRRTRKTLCVVNAGNPSEASTIATEKKKGSEPTEDKKIYIFLLSLGSKKKKVNSPLLFRTIRSKRELSAHSWWRRDFNSSYFKAFIFSCFPVRGIFQIPSLGLKRERERERERE